MIKSLELIIMQRTATPQGLINLPVLINGKHIRTISSPRRNSYTKFNCDYKRPETRKPFHKYTNSTLTTEKDRKNDFSVEKRY